MPGYQIVGNRVKLSDDRFDQYLKESLQFFSRLESIAGSPPPRSFQDTKDLIEWRNKRWQEIQEAIENCRHKIRAVKYNMALIESEIKLPPIIGQKVVPIDLEETEFLNDVVLFEFESLLFQVMSSLDVFVHLLKLFYPALDSKNEYQVGFKGKEGRAGKRTVESLQVQSPELAAYIDGQVTLWIQRIYNLRNIAVHRSKVHSLQMFLIDERGIHMPTLSDDGTDLLTFCNSTYELLKDFLLTSENDFLLPLAARYYEVK